MKIFAPPLLFNLSLVFAVL